MSIRTRWQAYQRRRAQQYLQAHSTLALDVLRQDASLGAHALRSMFTLDAESGAPDRRSYAYPMFQSFGMGAQSPLARTIAKPLSWQVRSFAENPTARRAINALCNPILDLPFTIAVRPPLTLQAHDVQPPPTADQARRIAAATAMFERPNDELAGREFLEILLEDLVCLGACPFEAQPNHSDPRPLFLWPIECETVRINARWQPGAETFRYSQSRAYTFGSNAGSDEVTFLEEALCYPRLNPRAHTPFGLGYLEVALATVNAFITSFDFATRKASNSVPNHLLFLGENVTPDQVRAFQHYWENEVEGYGKTPILGGGRQPMVASMVGAGEDPLYLKWQEWLVRIIAMSFGLSPMRLGLERDINRSTADQGSSDDWATIAPVANALKTAWTTWLLWHRLGWTDLEFLWSVKTTDELKQADVLSLQYTMNGITVDEIRQIYERPALKDGRGDMTKTAYESTIGMEAALQVQAAKPPPGGGPPGEEKPPPKDQDGMRGSTPLDDVGEPSPAETAFLRALMRHTRRARNGHAVRAD